MFVKFKRSHLKHKKYDAILKNKDTNRYVNVPFGARGYHWDYTKSMITKIKQDIPIIGQGMPKIKTSLTPLLGLVYIIYGKRV